MIASEMTSKQYIVRVFQQGVVIGDHLIDAPDALKAINFVERYYYQPVRWEKTFIDNGDGKLHEVATASNWRGYMFEAHATELAASCNRFEPRQKYVTRRCKMTVVTISRESGTGSREIAAEVAKLLGYRHFDKWSIVKVAAEMGLSESEVIDFSEEDYQVTGFLDRLLGRPSLKIPTRKRDGTGAETLTVEQLDEAVCVDLIQAAIQAAYQQEDMVILGRGSQAILQGKPHAFHVRVVAPLDDRVRRIMGEHESVTRPEAQNWAIRQDRKTAEYLKRFFGIAWEDPTLYHLVINVGKLEPWQAAKIIAEAVAVAQISRVSLNLP